MRRWRHSALVHAGGLLIFLSLVNHFPWAQSVAKSAAPASASTYDRDLARYQRYHVRLYDLLKRIVRPTLKSFESGGIKYQLPLSAKDAVIEGCSEDELAYLSGFFDGDGCVLLTKAGTFHLKTRQSLKGVDVCLRSRRAFGGGIYYSTDGCGFRQPVVSWELAGTRAKEAATLLARHSYTKEAQLRVAMNGTVAKDNRSQVQHRLKDLKAAKPVSQNSSVTWAYLAGLFDAEGYVQVPPDRNSICLHIKQKYDEILHVLVSFLEDEGLNRLNSFKIYHVGNVFLLQCSRTNVSMQTLQQLLLHGLSLKRDQAQSALQLNATNRWEVRETLFQLSGQQNRYKRLDRHGMETAAKIHQLQANVRCCQDQIESKLLNKELQLLKEEHELQKLKYNCSLMSFDIRRMLNEGAHFRPLESKKATCISEVQQICTNRSLRHSDIM